MMKRAIKNEKEVNKSGFTLLEVAISLAIISVVFVSLTTLFNTSIGITDYSKKLTAATFLAQKIMTEKELEKSFMLGESEETALEDDFKGYSYKIDVKETIFPLIQEANLTVYFNSVLKKHALNVTAYITDFEEATEEEEEEEESEGTDEESGGEKDEK
jgi:prepilin-type N-terminal cleavage/methylation domain-containing protein